MPHVLLIDDDDTVRLLSKYILHDAGFEVTALTGGRRAAEAFRRYRPDVVVTDLLMPDFDGLEVIRALRQEDPAVRILAVSGGGHRRGMNLLDAARLIGAAEVLDKPFSRGDLVDAVRRVLLAA